MIIDYKNSKISDEILYNKIIEYIKEKYSKCSPDEGFERTIEEIEKGDCSDIIAMLENWSYDIISVISK